jgi:hypothetical protein
MTYHDDFPQNFITLATQRETTPALVKQTRQQTIEIGACGVQTNHDDPRQLRAFQ